MNSRIFTILLYITTSCGEPYTDLQILPRTLPRLLQWQGITWYDMITYRTSSIAVFDEFFRTTGIDRATLARESNSSTGIFNNMLRRNGVLSPDKINDMIAAMHKLLDSSTLDEKSRTNLLDKIDSLLMVTRVERVVMELHRNQKYFTLNQSQHQDVKRILAIREMDTLKIQHWFAESKRSKRAASLPKVFKRALKNHQITLDDMRNYSNTSSSMLLLAMRSMLLSITELSARTKIRHSNLMKYMRGKSIIRDKNMAKIEAVIRKEIGNKRDQKKLDAFFSNLYNSLRIERAVLSLVAKQIKLPDAIAEIISRILKIRRNAQQLSIYLVTPKDVQHYRRSSFAIFEEILQVTKMTANKLSIASGFDKSVLPGFLKKRKIFNEEILRRLEKFLHRKSAQYARLTPLCKELRRAFHVERAAQKIRQDNIKPLPTQQELLSRVDKANNFDLKEATHNSSE